MAAIVQLDAVIPVVGWSGYDFGAEAVQKALKAKGYYAVVTPSFEAKKLRVTLKRSGGGVFDDATAKTDINTAAGSFFTRLAAFKEWAVQTVAATADAAKELTPSAIADTAQKYWKDEGFLKTLGIPGWVPWVVGGFVALYALNTLVGAKKAFLGAAPETPDAPREGENWRPGMSRAYSAGLEDARAGRPNRAAQYTFVAAYNQGYRHGSRTRAR